MYTILLSILFGALVGASLRCTDVTSTVWAVVLGLLAAVAAFALASRLLGRRLAKRMAALQSGMEATQKRIQAKIKSFEFRPVGSPQQMMREIEAEQGKALRAALEKTDTLEPFVGWIPLMGRQIATMRMQFHYQLKEFDKVDALLSKCVFLDPISASMRLAQMYRRKEPAAEIRKVFDALVRRFKYNQSVLPYSLMAWIYIQAEDADAAHKLLLQACRDNEHDTLKRNRDKLANNRPREFSNAGLGDQWYALWLEQPKIKQRRVMPRMDGRPF